MRHALAVPTFVLATLLSGACAAATASPNAAPHAAAHLPATYADSVFTRMDKARRNLASMHSRSDSLEVGGILTHWEAWYSGNQPRFIRETIWQEDFGARSNEYFFEHAELKAFVSRGDRPLNDPKNPRAGPYVLRVVWGRAGAVDHADKSVAGAPIEVDDNEAAGAKSRGEWLFQLVRTPAR